MKPGKPSITARAVAECALLNPKNSGLPLEAEIPMIQALLKTHFPIRINVLHWLRKLSITQLLTSKKSFFSFSGYIRHVIIRKNFIRMTMSSAIKNGCLQVVVLGAGLDTLAVYGHQIYPKVLFIEVDHPDTQSFKKDFFKEEQSKNFHFLALDFQKDNLLEQLTSIENFSLEKPTLFVAEGLLMYLDNSVVESLFHMTNSFSKATFIGSFALKNKEGDILMFKNFSLIEKWLERLNEKFLWGKSKDSMKLWLQNIGFKKPIFYSFYDMEEKVMKLKNNSQQQKNPLDEMYFIITKNVEKHTI